MGFNAVLLVSFVAVIVVQAVNRTAGAIASVVWCLGLGAYGVWMFENGASIGFLGVPVQLWQFLIFVAVMLAYNLYVLTRQLRTRAR